MFCLESGSAGSLLGVRVLRDFSIESNRGAWSERGAVGQGFHEYAREVSVEQRISRSMENMWIRLSWEGFSEGWHHSNCEMLNIEFSRAVVWFAYNANAINE